MNEEPPGGRSVGVAENSATAARVEELFNNKAETYSGFYVTDVDHEAEILGKNLDQFFQDLTDRIRDSGVSEPLKSHINSRLKSVRYYNKTVFVFEVEGQSEPSLFGNKFYERQGAQVVEVQAQKLSSLFSRFK